MARKTLNAASMKMRNQKKVIENLIMTPYSRAELARITGLTRASISNIADELLADGLIKEGEPILGKVGRKSHVLELNPNRYYMIGIDIARDAYHIGFMDFKGTVLYSTCITMEQSAADTLNLILAILKKQMSVLDLPKELLGIGITAPGPLNTQEGIILTPPNFENWFHVNVVGFFKKEFHCPVILENNASARALAEKYKGIGNQYTNFVELLIDTGLGSGIILGGSLYPFSSGFGNNFGHMSIDFDGPLCKCGNLGCAELYASIPNILNYGKKLDPHLISWNVVIDEAIKGTPAALNVVEKESEYLSVLITNIMNILDVECIILSGTIAYRSELLIGMLKKKLKTRYLSRDCKSLEILPSAIKKEAPVIAASYLVIEKFIHI